jgi:hypothetical protein
MYRHLKSEKNTALAMPVFRSFPAVFTRSMQVDSNPIV